jgi:predicted house-cleaning noncanonical NTP pyrophosphatase (MazG superfamily)
LNQSKLVRDMVPQIIRSQGQEPITHIADAKEYAARLRDKLTEEVAEFLASDNAPEELVDILEVLYALAELAGADPWQLEQMRAAKAKERGGFAQQIIWSGNRPMDPGVQAQPAPLPQTEGFPDAIPSMNPANDHLNSRRTAPP